MPGNRIRVKAAKLHQKRVFIVSYTDSEGAYEYNLGLSKRPRGSDRNRVGGEFSDRAGDCAPPASDYWRRSARTPRRLRAEPARGAEGMVRL